ncbi:hypothetical protein D3C72_1597120 [compost metagenome]
MPSGEKQTPLGTLNETELANCTTSSATRRLLRSVTCQTLVLRVPTKTTPVDGSTAMWRASGTTAYSSILKPCGSLIVLRFSRMASARAPVCGTVSGVAVPVGLKLCSFWRLSGAAMAGARARNIAAAAAEDMAVLIILSSPEFFLCASNSLGQESAPASCTFLTTQ